MGRQRRSTASMATDDPTHLLLPDSLVHCAPLCHVTEVAGPALGQTPKALPMDWRQSCAICPIEYPCESRSCVLPIRRPQDDQASLRTPVGIYRAQVHMAEAGVRIRACKFEIDPSGFIELG